MREVLRCPQCGGVIAFDESFDAFYAEDTVTISCVGTCHDCRQDFLYNEVYTFSHYEGIQKVENYNV